MLFMDDFLSLSQPEDFPDHVSFYNMVADTVIKADWRRDNVNVLIKEIHETVREV